MRVSEIINLKISDIDSDRSLIYIYNAKGNKDRVVPLSDKIRLILRDYYKEFNPKTYLFNGQFGLKYSSKSCNQIVKKYLGENYHFHTLRHSSFTALLECGTDLRIIQSIAGHSSSKTTEIYTHVSNNLLNKVQLPI
jgi:site-specific recombinase XerD